ncbi:hypothetical protein [Ensifer adhaerens]
MEVASPLTGLIVHYRGWLRPASEPTADLDGRKALVNE